MNLLIGSVLATVLLLTTACSPGAARARQTAIRPAATGASPAGTAGRTPDQVAVSLVEPSAFSGANARRHVDQLAGTIGARPAGSDPERTAAAYLSAQLTKWGYHVEQQSFSFTTVADHSVLQVITGGPRQVPASLITRSAQGTVRGLLVDAGLGISPAPGSLSGRVTLLERGQLTFEDKVSSAARAGATAVLIFNNQPGRFGGAVQNPSTIPGLTISREDGLRLRQALAAGDVQVEVRASAEVITLQSQNVVARTGRECAVIIGGHYDSLAGVAGANDNASGTGVTLEAARVLAPVAAAGKLCFVAFGAEETGINGSQAFVAKLDAGQRSTILGMINLDMVGVGTSWLDVVGLRTSWKITGDAGLTGMASEAARRVSVRTRADTTRGAGGSDHLSFTRVGIPAVFIHLNNDAMYHTPRDTRDRVDPANLESAGRIVVILAQNLMKQR